MIGKTLSHYKVLEKIGQGGMGEVFLAQDTTLDRKVALKFLLEEMQQDSTAKKRFLREAKSAAALDHPYICHIHEVGEVEGKSFISMEYVQGGTLQDKLAQGPLALKDALEKATEVAEALEEAHKQGIVHRDLKPSNIMLTPQGHVKVMDFGLAKRMTPDQEEEITTTALTQQGSTLGTVPYMSPEQVRGKEVDTRSDIFSFGLVLYEMLSGVNPFKKGSTMDTATAILSETPPPLTRYTEGIPVLLQHTVKKMLAKEPDRRYQLVHDVWTNLEDIRSEIDRALVEPTTAPPTSQTPPRIQPLAMAVGLVVLTAIVTSLVVWSLIRSSRPVSQLATQFVITPEAPLGDAGGNELAISPDGRRVVYVAKDPSVITQLYMRSLDDPVSRAILGTEGAAGPFFSPDGESVAFFAGGKLKRVSVMGGPPMTLCDAPAQGPSGSWGSEDRIVFTTGPGGLYRVPATGGEPERLAVPDPDKGEVKYRRPYILPDGEDVLFTIGYGSNNFDTAVLSLETGEKRIVVKGGRDAYYLPTGHLSYGLQDGTVVVVPFDLAKIEVMGKPVPTLAGVRASITGSLDYAFSDEGTLVYSRNDLQRILVWVSRQGTERPLIQEKRGYLAPRISPDGTRLSVTDIDGHGNRQVWIYEMARGILTPFTFQRGTNVTALWTPDGERLTFHSHRIDQDIFWKAADGSGEAELLETNPNGKLPTSWSPDGKVLAFSRRSGIGHVGSDWDIWLLASEGQGWEAQPFVQSPFNESHAAFSPGGGWVAFNSDRSGRNEVYVKPYPGEGGILPISTDGGSDPVWARNGNELFYWDAGKMMVVAVQTEPFFKAETPRLLFEGTYVFRNGASGYDISIDGEQFVMVKGQGNSTQIHVVLNWFEELKRLVPTN